MNQRPKCESQNTKLLEGNIGENHHSWRGRLGRVGKDFLGHKKFEP